MDIEKAQKVIDETVGSQFVVYKIEDSEKYGFAHYKHRDCDMDDQRGRLVGVGPVIFIKETGEYRLLGALESMDYLQPEQECPVVVLPSLEEIKEKIIRHKFVNDGDIFDLQSYWEDKFGDPDMNLTYYKGFDFRNFTNLGSSNKDFLAFIKSLWTELQLPFEITDENQLVLSRRKLPKI
ncbi:hypothetical protein [Flavobacterium sp.]|uniref:hypothetical protein n=1 Tax=Flavobacterium sp. TaxID=239 RepID=UPI0011FB4FD0|nr:hypothetical protein [Flavobacterium sp.]RZJ69545.1 MAG: hypothetical protein EOO49_17130 [Flavobacterium sp.]